MSAREELLAGAKDITPLAIGAVVLFRHLA